MLLDKSSFRHKVADIKRCFAPDELRKYSNEVVTRLVSTSLFENAHTVLCYYSMLDEVDTRELLHDYAGKKRFLLPVVSGDRLLLKYFEPYREMSKSAFGIWEPTQAGEFEDYGSIDAVIVPGVAFDKELHRLGRGKGYYDRLLPSICAPKIGICFDFQLFDHIPFNENDIKIDVLVTQSDTLGVLNNRFTN